MGENNESLKLGEKMEYIMFVNMVLQIYYAVRYPVEFLNTFNPLGFPTHMLLLKIETSIILLRNILPPNFAILSDCA